MELELSMGITDKIHNAKERSEVLKSLFCKHEYIFVRNIYGDEIIHRGFKRSEWKCDECGKIKLSDKLHEDKSRKQISDGYHTFEELYFHRMILFAVICNHNKDKAWKSRKHYDGTMFEDSFIVGIETPEGHYTYHYNSKYWDLFKIGEMVNAPEWDGHRPKDVTRLLSL